MDATDQTAMPTADPKPKPARTRKPKPANTAASKRSLNLSIHVDDYKRLATHALMQDTTISDLVSRLAREHLREFHISRTPGRGESEAV